MDREFDRRDVPFNDRVEAGIELARHLQRYAGRVDTTVLGLPRGGVPVAAAVAAALGAPLDVFTVRKLGVPGHREVAMGAIAAGGIRILNRELIDALDLSDRAVDDIIAEEERELARRERLYRGGRPALVLANRIAILVDDGLATGSTMRAAVRALRDLHPARIVVAAPVASIEACRDLETVADEVICARIPRYFMAVGQWYLDFSETSDAEVTELLVKSPAAGAAPAR
jgi:predicted phosphoribosyltransferase